EPLHTGAFRDVSEISRGGSIENKILRRRKFCHRIIRESGKKNYLVVTFEIFFMKIENILLRNFYFLGQTISEPQQVDYIYLVASVKNFRNDYGTNVSGPSCTENFHFLVIDY